MRVLSRNPKTGIELVRIVHSHGHYPCDGCGRDQDTNGNARAMYRYGEWDNKDLGDLSRIRRHEGVYCSKPFLDATLLERAAP